VPRTSTQHFFSN